jgi:hypothetical protein
MPVCHQRSFGMVVSGDACLITLNPAFPGCGGILMTSAVDSGKHFRAIEAVERAWDGGRDG